MAIWIASRRTIRFGLHPGEFAGSVLTETQKPPRIRSSHPRRLGVGGRLFGHFRVNTYGLSVATIVDDGTVIMASCFLPSFGGIAAGGGAVGVMAGAVIIPPQPPQLLAIWLPPHELQLLQQLDWQHELQPLLMPMQPPLE